MAKYTNEKLESTTAKIPISVVQYTECMSPAEGTLNYDVILGKMDQIKYR